jgi:hypothetical protein
VVLALTDEQVTKIQYRFERHEPFALSIDHVVHRFFAAADETILSEAKMVAVVAAVNCAYDQTAIAAVVVVEEQHQFVFDFVFA